VVTPALAVVVVVVVVIAVVAVVAPPRRLALALVPAPFVPVIRPFDSLSLVTRSVAERAESRRWWSDTFDGRPRVPPPLMLCGFLLGRRVVDRPD